MTRVVQPELLDTLPASDADAVASRHDIRRLNLFMGHHRLLARALANTAVTPHRIVDLGAGDGSLALRLARTLARRWPGVALVLVDRQPVISDATLAGLRRYTWTPRVVAADVLEWMGASSSTGDLIFANLFLHHFTEGQLRALFRLIASRTGAFVALDPRRHAWPLLGCRFLRLLGCNQVTCHDAPVSVRAGFRDRELSALWPSGPGWRLDERSAGVFSHLFSAQLETG